MRFGLLSLDTGVGVQTDAGIKPLDTFAGDNVEPVASVRAMLPDWERWCQRLEQLLDEDSGEGWASPDQSRILPPIPDAPTLYCAGANYLDHLHEMGIERPEDGTTEPFHFLLPPASLAGHGALVPRPANGERLDWEAELAVVIGRPADRVTTDQALAYVAGYTVANDISLRGRDQIRHPWFGLRWLMAKGQRAMTPLGPALIPARFIPDPMNLELRLTVNGQPRQAANTSQMIFSVAEQIAHISAFVPLLPGDVILTGTPAGTGAVAGYLQDSDVISATIDGIGTLTNQIVATAVVDGDA